MSTNRWGRVTELFHEASLRPASEREGWLAANCDDPVIRREVEAMLRAYDRDPGFLEQPANIVDGVARAMAGAQAGRRLGSYRLGREIGRGGMGVVYEAHRDDQEFDRTVAIKILPSWSGAELAERFRRERRVLATLDHPGIARLIDSGTTDDGAPYFVMEFVDGKPIDDWCQDQRLSIADSIALVARVCDALSYAHQHLVIHRDVKPANILVTDDGQPKLLDFGIATLLTAEGETATGMTRTAHRSFTPDYASPEQVRGEPVTTASDVYSLGMVLYRLLTRQPPYSLTGLAPLEALQVVCDKVPPLMSAVADTGRRSTLRGDLDAIVAKALNKSPRDRYATITDFARDLEAWRSGRPVTAARQSVMYRATRFVRRHVAAVSAAAAVIVALLAGGVATAWQARIAAEERDKAQNRFRQVREFSRSLLFEVHGALRDVPGATESRRLLLDRAVQFLDGLAADAGDDDDLKLELATGYQQLANVQGNERSQNVGDTLGAKVSYQKAARLIDEARRRRPDDAAALIQAVNVRQELILMSSTRGDADVVQTKAEHDTLVNELEREHTGNARAIATVAQHYSDIGLDKVGARDFDAAEAAYHRAIQMFESLPESERELRDTTRHSYALKRLAAVLMQREQFDESEQRYRQALKLDEAMIRLDDRPQTRYDMTFTLSDFGLMQARRRRWDDAIEMFSRALEIRRAAFEADPKDTRAMVGVATLLGRLGMTAAGQDDWPASAVHYRAELAVREQAIGAQGLLPARVAERAWARLNLATALLNQADRSPGHSSRPQWLAEAGRLVRACGRADGKPPVTAGSEAGYLALLENLTKRLNTR
jgi:non-specific serine/threonine protein kinase/serine/threonine-protein kinase